MTPEYIIGTILVGGIGATFALYQRGVNAQIAAKDAEVVWLRSQLESWALIGRTAVSGLEKLTEKTP